MYTPWVDYLVAARSSGTEADAEAKAEVETGASVSPSSSPQSSPTAVARPSLPPLQPSTPFTQTQTPTQTAQPTKSKPNPAVSAASTSTTTINANSQKEQKARQEQNDPFGLLAIEPQTPKLTPTQDSTTKSKASTTPKAAVFGEQEDSIFGGKKPSNNLLADLLGGDDAPKDRYNKIKKKIKFDTNATKLNKTKTTKLCTYLPGFDPPPPMCLVMMMTCLSRSRNSSDIAVHITCFTYASHEHNVTLNIFFKKKIFFGPARVRKVTLLLCTVKHIDVR